MFTGSQARIPGWIGRCAVRILYYSNCRVCGEVSRGRLRLWAISQSAPVVLYHDAYLYPTTSDCCWVLSSSQVSQSEDPSQLIDNVDSIRSAGRFLRAQAQVDEERVNLKLSPESEKWLAGKSSAELEKLAQAPKNVNAEELLAKMKVTVEEHFMSLAKSGVTPKSMRKEYNIKEMRKTMSKSTLMRDADYQEYVRFKEFWNKLPKKLKREFLSKATS